MRNVNIIHRTGSLHRVRNCALYVVVLSAACNPFRQRSTYAVLPVTGKDGISVLLSNDARCLVPTKEFPKVTVGQLYACNWRQNGVAVAPKAAVKASK